MTSEPNPADSGGRLNVRELEAWLLGSGVLMTIGLAWTFIVWFVNGYADFIPGVILVTGAVVAGTARYKAYRMAVRGG